METRLVMAKDCLDRAFPLLTHLPAFSNGCFFNMGARLARFTGNSTFADQAEETWNWLTGVGFIDNETWAVYDGAHVENNCTDISKAQWSYNPTVLIQGAAFMYNYVSHIVAKFHEIATDMTNVTSDQRLRRLARPRRQALRQPAGDLLPGRHRLRGSLRGDRDVPD